MLVFLHFTPWILAILVLMSNFVIDESRLSLFSAFHTSITNPYKKYYYISNQERNVEYSFEQCQYTDGSITVSVFDNRNKELLSIGGKTGTYIGLYDFNKDGLLDIYLFSTSIWPQKGVWLATDDGYKYFASTDTFEFHAVKFFAYANIYFLVLLATSFIWNVLILILGHLRMPCVATKNKF
jgi:hypothetical protein